MVFVFILIAVYMSIFLIFNGYWGCTFARRIYCYRKYKRGVGRCLSGDSGYLYKQFYYHYETEIWKNTLLLLIISSESIVSIFYFASGTIQYFLANHQISNNTLESPTAKCINYLKPALEPVNILYTEIPNLNGLGEIARSAGLFGAVFSTCLMNYLIIRIKKIKQPYDTFNYRQFLIITTLLSTVIILTGFIQYTTVISIVLFFVSVNTYLCIFVHTSKRFKYALLQRALERLTQYGSNKEEMKQYRYCKHTINIVTCGYLFMILGQALVDFMILVIRALFYGNCYFPFDFFPSLNLVIETVGAIETFFEVVTYIELIGATSCYIGIVVFLFPMVYITIHIWIQHIRRYIHGKETIKYSTVDPTLK